MYSARFSIFLLIVTFSHIHNIQGIHINATRSKRAIWGPVTSTVFKTIEEKHYVPASCLYMSPNLPACRNVRFLFPGFNQNGFNFFNKGNSVGAATITDKNNITTNNIGANRRGDVGRSESVTNQGWGEYLGLYRPTVTETRTVIQPTTVLDTRIVITYAVKGCKPHNLPQNMEKCSEDDPLNLVEILPTSTIHAKIEATRVPEKIEPKPHAAIESAEIDNFQEVPDNTARATKSL